jgi:hypothetical protein
MDPAAPYDELTLPEALHSLRVQLMEAMEWAGDERLTFAIDSLELELQLAVTLVRKGQAKVGLWSVVTAGGGIDHSRAQTHRVKLVLQPIVGEPDPEDPRTRVSQKGGRPG